MKTHFKLARSYANDFSYLFISFFSIFNSCYTNDGNASAVSTFNGLPVTSVSSICCWFLFCNLFISLQEKYNEVLKLILILYFVFVAFFHFLISFFSKFSQYTEICKWNKHILAHWVFCEVRVWLFAVTHLYHTTCRRRSNVIRYSLLHLNQFSLTTSRSL